MLVVLLFLLGGIVIGILIRRYGWVPKIAEKLISLTIYLLLFTLGIKAGFDRHITSQIHTLGLTALAISSFAIAGSILLIWVVFKFFLKNNHP